MQIVVFSAKGTISKATSKMFAKENHFFFLYSPGTFEYHPVSLNIKFGVNLENNVIKTSVSRFNLYGKYQTVWTNQDHF